METIIKNDYNSGKPNAKKKVILDNEYLPFVPIKQTLLDMEVGDIVAWPAWKMNSVRILASRIKKEIGREFKCVTNRKEKTAEVLRLT